MPYSDALRDMAAWFVQLWAESLGKQRRNSKEHVGPTPLSALGATDQHSQVQLFMEGPADKTVTFVSVAGREGRGSIPKLYPDVADLAYLGGHTLGEVLEVERRATAGALARRGRPNMTIELDAVDPWHVGALIFLLEMATAYAGELYGVNAFDQPGVELGKQFTYAMLGRPGSDAARAEWDLLPKPDPKRRAGADVGPPYRHPRCRGDDGPGERRTSRGRVAARPGALRDFGLGAPAPRTEQPPTSIGAVMASQLATDQQTLFGGAVTVRNGKVTVTDAAAVA